MVEVDPPNILLQDLKSSNGTRVNDVRIAAPTPLRHGDTFGGGNTKIQVSVAMPAAIPVGPSSSGNMAAADGPVAVRCGLCGTKAGNEMPRTRAEKMAYFCDACQAKLIDQPRLPANYELVRVLGKGAMGAVYLARHTGLGRSCAIKMVLPKVATSERMRLMFEREARSQAQLDHPRIVRVLDFQATAHGIYCLVMEAVEGPSGDKLLEQNPRGLEASLATEIVAQALEGLAHAHGRGIVHRDIKESNILVGRGDSVGGIAVKLSDFGLAKSYETSGASGFTTTGSNLGGTIPYMPPEQILDYRSVKPPADIYAMGATLYRLLTNQFAYDFRQGTDPFVTILEEPVIPIRTRNPAVPARLAAVAETALRKDPAQRFATADAMRAALLNA
jgi:serine/threonine-protein kinase